MNEKVNNFDEIYERFKTKLELTQTYRGNGGWEVYYEYDLEPDIQKKIVKKWIEDNKHELKECIGEDVEWYCDYNNVKEKFRPIFFIRKSVMKKIIDLYTSLEGSLPFYNIITKKYYKAMFDRLEGKYII